MRKRLAADRQDNLIRVDLGHGCYLLLTWAEYAAGIERGKRERRKLSARTRIGAQVTRAEGNYRYEYQDRESIGDFSRPITF